MTRTAVDRSGGRRMSLSDRIMVGALRVGGTDWGLAKVRPDLCTFLALVLALALPGLTGPGWRRRNRWPDCEPSAPTPTMRDEDSMSMDMCCGLYALLQRRDSGRHMFRVRCQVHVHVQCAGRSLVWAWLAVPVCGFTAILMSYICLCVL